MAGVIEQIKKELTFENVLSQAMKVPGVKINRKKFLTKELTKYYSKEVIERAVEYNPATAGIPRWSVDKISIQVINVETKKATGLSVAASLPSSIAVPTAIGAAATDIVSYFSFILRVVQQLAYLYGFPDFELNENEIDAETMNFIIVFLGVMFGAQGATSALTKLAKCVEQQVAKKLAAKALMNGTIYPFIKKVAQQIGIRMTKQIFADTVASAVPLLGSALSGAITYTMFKPRCMKLRNRLRDYSLCVPSNAS